jgi:rRNA-processing protein FCF1
MKVNCPECKRRIRIRKNKRINTCKCGYEFPHNHFFGNGRNVFLVDANVFIYAINNDRFRGKHCIKVLNSSHSLATTKSVIKEVKQWNKYRVKIYHVKEISKEVDELHYNSLKQLSKADKTLIQCAIDNPEISGIITNDPDIKNVVPSRLIRSEKKFFIGRPNEFLKKYDR